MFALRGIAFSIFGFDVYWYGILIALGIALAVVLACFLCKHRNLSKDDIFELLLWVLPPAIIGARLYYLIFNNGPWGWEAFAIWNGGLAVYGSVIGGAIGVIIYCVVRKKNFLDVADVVVPCLLLGQAVGRIGCFCSGCCYGFEITDPAWQFFPVGIYLEDGSWHLATMIYESFFCFVFCAILSVLIRKTQTKGLCFGLYMLLYGTLRAVLENFRDASEALFIGPLKVSLLLSIMLAVAGLCLVLWQVVQTKRKRRV